MVVLINNSDSKRVSITVETPSGKRYTLYKGYPMKKILTSRRFPPPVFFVKEGDKVVPEKV